MIRVSSLEVFDDVFQEFAARIRGVSDVIAANFDVVQSLEAHQVSTNMLVGKNSCKTERELIVAGI